MSDSSTRLALAVLLGCGCAHSTQAASRPDQQFEVFQFPKDQIPRIDGSFADWNLVPERYAIGLDQLMDTERGRGIDLDPADFDLSVKVAWVEGLNRLYFYYDASDDDWDFARSGLKNDIFEVVVDGNLSGGSFINTVHPHKDAFKKSDLHFMGHGEHAQNYHVFTPSLRKEWAMVWGNAPWIKDFPHANAAQSYSFQHGEGGRYQLEFYITAFDHADLRGPAYSTESDFRENGLIGLSWCILEYDDEGNTFEAFMNLAHDTEMVRDASSLCLFKLMPIEPELQPAIQANWSVTNIGTDRRSFKFEDRSHGEIQSWHWDFGDGNSSNEPSPIHHYTRPGQWVVRLSVRGPAGEDSLEKIWDVVTP
ncbi:PKD domain-containing protein [Pelagicoccus sp. NFK12]|uniref:PKD domain-containing protein n=1 Tax=Pelagicoccus enzymogenes TaxID=2773457 RepID=A0A927FAQ6_9BACT|nr:MULTISPECIES: PKD domain-containing protein [Pelagicoccus]MBD5781622.1 PKD domain-containing protein [Pelagicoccus enzymogenes]MDQ8181143.1 PKD domain-containing protein [Pelagicoccus sp. SDUM812005]